MAPHAHNAAFDHLVCQQAHLFGMQRELAAMGKAYVAGEVARIFASTPRLASFEMTVDYEWAGEGDQQHRKCLPMARVTFAYVDSDSLVLTDYFSGVQAEKPDDIDDMQFQFWSLLDESGVLDRFGKALDTGTDTIRFAATRKAFEQLLADEPNHPAVASAACK